MHALQQIAARTRPSSVTTLDGSDIEYVDNYKYLGVWLDCKLSFQTHIKHLQSKMKSRISFLFRKKSILHSCCQTYPCKTDYPTNPWLWWCNLQNSLPTLYSANWMQSITVPSVWSPNPHIQPTTATCILLLAGPRNIFVAKPTGSRSPISLC